MRVFVAVDMEGTTGLERLEEIFRGLPGFDTFRQVMAGDANAVVQGAIEGNGIQFAVGRVSLFPVELQLIDMVV